MSDIKIPVVLESVVEERIVPATGCYVIEVVYKKTEQQRIESAIVSCAVEPVLVNPIILIKAVTIFYSFFCTVEVDL